MAVDPADFGAVPVTIDPAQFGALTDLDEERGAPVRIRTAVGAAANPADQLSTLQMYYPDAVEWGSDNFVYTDPETKSRTLYNPKGLDAGDVSESARMIFEFIGGSIGGAAALAGGQLGPQVAVPEELVTVPLATGAGAAGAGLVYDTMADFFFPNVETRSMLQRVGDVSVDVMANAASVSVGDALGRTVKAGVTKAKGVTGELAKAFKDMGAKPTAGAISGSKTIQGIEQALHKLPASSDVIGKEYTQLIDDMGKYAENVARGVSPVEGREVVGAKIQSGAKVFVSQFKDKAKVLYDNVDRFLPANVRTPANGLGSQLNKTAQEFADDPEFAEFLTSPLFKQLKTAFDASDAKGGMTYQTMKALRTKIGNMIGDPKLLGDTAEAELKQLYAGLSDDMTFAAAKAGPKATKAMERANAFWAAGRTRIDDVLNPVVNKKMSQDVFQAAMQGSKNGTQKLRALKESLPVDDWNALVAQQIREMGRATSGAQDAAGDIFSPATFMTNFDKLRKGGGDKVLFAGQQQRGLGEAIDNLVKTSAALKDTAKMANTSGTANQLIYMQMLTGGLGGAYANDEETGVAEGAIKGAAIATLLPLTVAKLMTSPKFINWLSESASKRVTANSISSSMTRLAAIAEKNEDIRPAIYEYMATFKEQQ